MTDSVAAQRVLRRADWKIEPVREANLPHGKTATLRPLVAADADALVEFFSSLTRDETHYFFELGKDAARNLALEADQATAFRLVTVDEHRGSRKILGYMFMEWRGKGPPECGACFRPGTQSGGLGRIMAEHLLRSAIASGVRRVYATVHPDNARSLRLIQRIGFTLVSEFINEHQGIKQYRMEMDLPPQHLPLIVDDLIVVPQGGIGVGTAAACVQSAVEAFTSTRPLILNHPPKREGSVIFVSDLATSPSAILRPSSPPIYPQNDEVGWIVGLDEKHLLIGGIGVEAVDRAARRYAQLLASSSAGERDAVHVRSLGASSIPLVELRATVEAKK